MSLQNLLDERKISKYRLSQLSGVPKTTIHDICSGRSSIENCSAKTVYRIAQVLDCSVEFLLENDLDNKVFNNQSTLLESINYITVIHALNIPYSLDTSGDWHASALSWKQPNIKNTKDSIWGDYGIELSEQVPENPGTHFVANHIRACLDLLESGRVLFYAVNEDCLQNEPGQLTIDDISING